MIAREIGIGVIGMGWMGLVHSRDQALVFLGRRGHHVHVRFQPRARDAFGIVIAGPPIQREILGTDLQHLALFLQPHARP